MEDRIAQSLGNPKTCPHGHPIPDKDGLFVKERVRPLSELKAAEKAIIVNVFEEDPKMLQYLSSLDYFPMYASRLRKCSFWRAVDSMRFRLPLCSWQGSSIKNKSKIEVK